MATDKAPKAPKPEKAAPAPKPAKIEQNGVVKPKEGSLTGNVWAICDRLKAATKTAPGRADVIEAAKAEKINEATASTQYGRWRLFHGIKSVPKAKVEKAAPAPKPAKAPKAAPKPAAAAEEEVADTELVEEVAEPVDELEVEEVEDGDFPGDYSED